MAHTLQEKRDAIKCSDYSPISGLVRCARYRRPGGEGAGLCELDHRFFCDEWSKKQALIHDSEPLPKQDVNRSTLPSKLVSRPTPTLGPRKTKKAHRARGGPWRPKDGFGCKHSMAGCPACRQAKGLKPIVLEAAGDTERRIQEKNLTGSWPSWKGELYTQGTLMAEGIYAKRPLDPSDPRWSHSKESTLVLDLRQAQPLNEQVRKDRLTLKDLAEAGGEAQISLGGAPLHLVARHTDNDRAELTFDDASALAEILQALPEAELVGITRPSRKDP